MAQHDNTVVEIIPSVTTRLNKPPGVPFTVTLNKEGRFIKLLAVREGASMQISFGLKIKINCKCCRRLLSNCRFFRQQPNKG
ncbi:MAG: IgGFc-binding protein [Chitinophagaceae bacterium]|nr:IgGFc-binding protein [Chitinophagaceae bacterium]